MERPGLNVRGATRGRSWRFLTDMGWEQAMMIRTNFGTPLACMLLATLISCGAGDAPLQAANSNAPLAAISVTPANPQMASHSDLQFIATGIYADHSTQDITAFVSWATYDESIAAISNATASQGLATSMTAGSVTITASLGGITGSASLTVTPATLVSVSIDPTTPSIALGTGRQFTATGIYSDNTTQDLTASATWSSSDPTVALISNAAGSQGLATAVAAGSATVTASSGGISGSTTLTTVTAVVNWTLTWDAVTTYQDGSPLDSVNYRLYYGASPGLYTTAINVGNGTTYAIMNFSSGTYFFAVTVYDASGNEGGYSNEVSIQIP